MTPGPRLVYWVIALGVAAVSTSAILVKLSEAPPIALAFYRVLLAWVALAPALLLRERAQLADVIRQRRRDMGWALLSGTFLALHYVVWFFSLRLTSVASSTVLVTTQPIWVMLLAYWLWRETVPLPSLFGIAAALTGTYFIGAHSAQQGGGQLTGDLLAVLAAVLVSGYLLIGQRLRPRMPLLVYVFFVYGAAAVVLGGLAAAMGVPLAGFPAKEWWLFAGLALGPTLLGHTVFNWALQHVPASVVAVGILGEPVGAVVLAMLILGEVPAPVQLLAGLLILGGIGLFLYFRDAAPAGRNGRVSADG